MNDRTCVMRAPRRVWLLDVLTATAIVGTVALALLTAACGGGSPAPPAGPPGPSAATAQALAYARCMRSHGVPGFPDPDSQGGLTITPKDHLNPGSPQFQSAQRACQHLAPGGPPASLTAGQLRQATRQGLRFVACMRAHAVPNMPDLTIQTVDSALVGGTSQVMNFDLRATGLSPNSPVLKSALQACNRLQPLGVAVSIEGAPRP